MFVDKFLIMLGDVRLIAVRESSPCLNKKEARPRLPVKEKHDQCQKLHFALEMIRSGATRIWRAFS